VSSRKARVADGIRDTLAEMIARDVKDPRVAAAGVVSVTHVDLNADISVATVYVSVFGDDRAADKAIEGLRGAAGFLRGPVARRLGLARPPQLRFVRDTGLAFGMELSRIVREDEAKASAAAAAAPAEAPDDDTEGASAADGGPGGPAGGAEGAGRRGLDDD
jgi:ribosome-binding factor A